MIKGNGDKGDWLTFITLSMKWANPPCVQHNVRLNTMQCKMQHAHLPMQRWHAQDSIMETMHAKHVIEPRALKPVKDITHEACTINLKWSNQLWTDLYHAKTMAKSCWK